MWKTCNTNCENSSQIYTQHLQTLQGIFQYYFLDFSLHFSLSFNIRTSGSSWQQTLIGNTADILVFSNTNVIKKVILILTKINLLSFWVLWNEQYQIIWFFTNSQFPGKVWFRSFPLAFCNTSEPKRHYSPHFLTFCSSSVKYVMVID